MKITPDGVRLLANSLQQASEALRDMAVFLSSLAVEPEQTELPTTGNSGGAVILTYPKEVQEAAKVALASIEPPDYSPGYLASKQQAEQGLTGKCVEVAPEVPQCNPAAQGIPGQQRTPEVKLESKPEEPITRQSLRALAEKLVAKGRLPDVKAALAKHGVTTLSALKTENYAAVQAEFSKLLVSWSPTHK